MLSYVIHHQKLFTHILPSPRRNPVHPAHLFTGHRQFLSRERNSFSQNKHLLYRRECPTLLIKMSPDSFIVQLSRTGQENYPNRYETFVRAYLKQDPHSLQAVMIMLMKMQITKMIIMLRLTTILSQGIRVYFYVIIIIIYLRVV